MIYFKFSSYFNNPSPSSSPLGRGKWRGDVNGFTFLELLIVISLISFLSIVGIASFVQYSGVQTFNSGVQDVLSILQQAKSNAQSQIKPSSCGVNEALHGYRVSLCDSNLGGLPACINKAEGTDYQVEVVCGGNDYTEGQRARVGVGKQFPDGVFLDTTSSPGSPQLTNSSYFMFTVLKGGVVNSNNSSTGTIVIQDTGGRTKTITIDSQGTISVN